MPAPHGSSAARAEPAGTAGVELTAKVLGEDGKIVDAKTFRASAPAKGTDAPAAAAARSTTRSVGPRPRSSPGPPLLSVISDQ